MTCGAQRSAYDSWKGRRGPRPAPTGELPADQPGGPYVAGVAPDLRQLLAERAVVAAEQVGQPAGQRGRRQRQRLQPYVVEHRASQRGRGAVDERQRRPRLPAHRGQPAFGQHLGGRGGSPAGAGWRAGPGLALARDRLRGVRQRHQVAAGGEAAVAGHDRGEAGVPLCRQRFPDLGWDTRATQCHAAQAKPDHQPGDLRRQRRALPDGEVRDQTAGLPVRVRVAGVLGERAEAPVDAVHLLLTGGRGQRGAAALHRPALRRAQGEMSLPAGLADQTGDRGLGRGLSRCLGRWLSRGLRLSRESGRFRRADGRGRVRCGYASHAGHLLPAEASRRSSRTLPVALRGMSATRCTRRGSGTPGSAATRCAWTSPGPVRPGASA